MMIPGPYPGLTGGGSLISGGGGAWETRAIGAVSTYRRVWGHAPPEFLFISLIEHGVSFCRPPRPPPPGTGLDSHVKFGWLYSNLFVKLM